MGSSSKTTNSTSNVAQTTTPNAPAWASDSLQGYNTQVQKLAATDPSTFVTGPTANQTAAYTAGAGLSTTNPNFAAGSADVSNNATIDPTQSSSIADFMNPYTQNVVNAATGSYDTQEAQTKAQMEGQAAMTGAFGGSRYGVAQGQEAATSNLNRANLVSGLDSTAYNQAVTDANQNAQLGQQAGTSLSAIAAQQGATTDASLATQDALGQDQRTIAQQQATAPISLAQTIGSLYGLGQFGLLTGSSTNGTTNASSTTTENPSILSDIEGAGSLLSNGLANGTNISSGATSLAKMFG